jgi:hypothetical protein
MRKILALLLFFCLPSLGAEGIKISDLPLLGGASVDAVDSFPALDASAGRTVRIRVGDLFLVPSLAAQLAPFTGKMANPMTTLGDIIYGGAAGAPARLAAGTSGYVLTSNGPGVAPSYQANPAGGITALTNEVIASGSGSVSATVTNSAVIGKLLTGFVPGAGAVAATDTVLQGFDKVVGNMALLAPLDSPTFTGTVVTSSISGVNVTGGSLSIQGGYSDTGGGGNLSFYGGTGLAGDGSQDGTVAMNSGSNGIQVSPTGIQITGTAAGTFSGNFLGNATTATALAANPTDCSAGQFANAIAANGNLTCATPSGGAAWGGITGTLGNQTDLAAALALKAPLLTPTFGSSITIQKTVSGSADINFSAPDRPATGKISFDWNLGSITVDATDDEVVLKRQGAVALKTTNGGIAIGSTAFPVLKDGAGNSLFNFSPALIRVTGAIGAIADNTYDWGYEDNGTSLLRPRKLAVGTQLNLPTGSSGTPALQIGSGETFPLRMWYDAGQLSMDMGLGGSNNLRFMKNGNNQIEAVAGAFNLIGVSALNLSCTSGQVNVKGSSWYDGGLLFHGHLAAETDNAGCLGCDFSGTETGNRFATGVFGTKVVAGAVKNTAAQTTLTGSAGTAVCSQPEIGTSYKKVLCYLSGYSDTDTQVYTFPTAFSHAPHVYGATASVAGTTASTTTIKFTTTTQTGFVFAEGY